MPRFRPQREGGAACLERMMGLTKGPYGNAVEQEFADSVNRYVEARMADAAKVAFSQGMIRATRELEAWANSHAALKAGHGNTDDALGFVAWLRALADDIWHGREPQ